MRYPIDAICNFSDRKRNLCQDYCCEPETTNEPLERDELTRQEQEEYWQSMYDDINDSENHEYQTKIAKGITCIKTPKKPIEIGTWMCSRGKMVGLLSAGVEMMQKYVLSSKERKNKK